MSAVDYTLVAFGVLMIASSTISAIGIVRRERGIRAMRETVKEAGEARGVGVGKDGGE